MTNIRVGCTYKVRGSNMQVLRYDRIDRSYVVRTRGREMRVCSLDGAERVATRKTGTAQTFLYLVDIGRGYFKLGASCNPERRRAQIATYAPKAVVLCTVPVVNGAAFRKYEAEVLSMFRPDKGGGREVIRLDSAAVRACIRAMRRVAVRSM